MARLHLAPLPCPMDWAIERAPLEFGGAGGFMDLTACPVEMQTPPPREGGVLLLGSLNGSADSTRLQPFVDLIAIVVFDTVDDT